MSQGLYVSLKLEQQSAEKLFDWAKQRNLNPLQPEEFHVTIVYSRNKINFEHIPKFENDIILDPLTFKVTKLDPALVLCFENKFVRQRWQHAIDLGATWDYHDFIPHISINYEGEKYDIIEPPDFFIRLTGEDKQHLDEGNLGNGNPERLEKKLSI